jgi:hypothetical protein
MEAGQYRWRGEMVGSKWVLWPPGFGSDSCVEDKKIKKEEGIGFDPALQRNRLLCQ